MADSVKMTFAKKVKTEIANNKYNSSAIKKRILSGFTRVNGILSIGRLPRLSYSTEVAQVAKLFFNFLKSLYGVSPTFKYERKMRFKKQRIYIVIVESPQVYTILEDLKVKKNLKPIPLRSMVNKENLRGFITGCFLASGSINSPSSKSYYLELAYADKEDAERVRDGLFQQGDFSPKIIQRRDKWVVYLKKSAEITLFLRLIGATQSMLDYENARTTKDLLNNENRLDICLAYNLSRTLKSSQQNIDDINKLLTLVPLESLEPKMKAVVQARLNNKEASLTEISEMVAEQGIFISRSSISRIFSNIHDMVTNK